MSEAKTTVEEASRGAPGSAGGMLATLPENSLALPQPGHSGPAYGSQADPLAGGLDVKRIWHAIRRRWALATAVGLGLAAIAAPAAWVFMPQGYEAVAWLRVRSNVGSFSGAGEVVYEQYRKTQLQLIKSPFVLNAALRRPGIAGLSVLKDAKDPVAWLTSRLQVSAPTESEVVQIRLRGSSARDVTQIVNAVTQAYLTDVVNKEKTERLARRDMLERKYKENMAEVRNRLETFNNLARSLGTRDSSEVSTQRSLLLDHLGTLRAQLTGLQRDLVQIDTELALIDVMTPANGADEGAPKNEIVEAAVMRHPQVAELAARLAELDETIAYQSDRSARGANDPSVRRLAAQRADLVRRIEERAAEVRPQVAVEMAGRQGPSSATNPMVLRMRREMIGKQIAEASKEFDQVAKEVTALGNANADIEARRNEIAQLQAVTNQVPDTSFHLTLCTLKIDDQNDLKLVKDVLDVVKGDESLQKSVNSLKLKFEGVGEFYNKVFYVKSHQDSFVELNNIRNIIVEKLRTCFVKLAGNYYDFVPHLTIFKVSRNSTSNFVKTKTNKTENNKKAKKEKIHELCVSQFVTEHVMKKYEQLCFGQQSLKEIDLCKMVNIFECETYPVEHTIKFDL